MSKHLAPIILFVYNRPDHTRQTLEALSANKLSDKSKLIVYADGPKNGSDQETLNNIDKVRKVVEEKRWCREVEIIYRSHNYGLAKSIKTGISETLERYGRVIVLEDDIVTSPFFLKYMNKALDMYEKDKKVMQISGFMLPHNARLPATFFHSSGTCWGWATWKDRWQHFNDDAKELCAKLKSNNRLSHFDYHNSGRLLKQLEKNISGEMNTWAIKWEASMYLKEGLCLFPRNTLVNNIGMDGTGVHCRSDNIILNKNVILTNKIDIKRIPLKANKRVWNMWKWYFKLNDPTPTLDKKIKFFKKRLWQKFVEYLHESLPANAYQVMRSTYRIFQ